MLTVVRLSQLCCPCIKPALFTVCVAEEKLQNLEVTLARTQQQLSVATADLQKLGQGNPGRGLTEDDKETIRSNLDVKISKVSILKMGWPVGGGGVKGVDRIIY